MATTSSNKGLTVPANLGDNNLWGTELNNTLGNLDTMLGGIVTLASTTQTTPWTLSSAQSNFGVIKITGAPVADYTLNFSSTGYALGRYEVWNAFTSSVSVICTCTGASTVTVAAGQVQGVLALEGAIVSDTDGGTF